MITNAPLPSELQNAIIGEKVDFILKSSRLKPTGEALYFLFFSLFWLAISLTVGAGFFLPLIAGEPLDIEINDVPTTVTQDNMDVMIFPAIFIGIFVLIGLALLSYSFYASFATGGWFIGMPEGLSFYRKGKTEFTEWEKFRSDVEASGDEQKGKVTLNLRSRGLLTIYGIPRPKEIAGICKQRIKGKEPSTK